MGTGRGEMVLRVSLVTMLAVMAMMGILLYRCVSPGRPFAENDRQAIRDIQHIAGGDK